MYSLKNKMGLIGAGLGRHLGSLAERGISHLYNKHRGKFGKTGQRILEGVGKKLKGQGARIGSDLGSLLPFKKGGRIKKTGKIYAHKGEFILPKGVTPTTHQIRIVKKLHRKK